MSKQLAQFIKAYQVDIAEHTIYRGRLPELIGCSSCEKVIQVPDLVQVAPPKRRVCFELYLYGCFQQFPCSDESSGIPRVSEFHQDSPDVDLLPDALFDYQTKTFK